MHGRNIRALAVALILTGAGVTPSAAAGVALVKEGSANAVLILPDAPAPDETLAAAELADHFEKISGAKLATAANGAIPEGLLPIRIGLALGPDAEAKIKTVGSDPAAFLLAVREDGIHLAGLSPEGTLFAAYELLEQVGVRWCMPVDLDVAHLLKPGQRNMVAIRVWNNAEIGGLYRRGFIYSPNGTGE